METDDPSDPIAVHKSRHTCVICDQQLDVHQAARSRVCDNPDCQRLWATQSDVQKRARRERNGDLNQSHASLAVNKLVEQKRLHRYGSSSISPVPASTSPLRPADTGRQEDFRQHIESLLSEWEKNEQQAKPVEPFTTIEAGPDPENMAIQACATCRGNCCRHGNTHAFVDLSTITRWMGNNPESNLEECRESYLSLLPSHSIDGSCVFHGNAGCRLPREMRADHCNGWICSSLHRLLTTTHSNPGPVTLIVAMDKTRALRVRAIQSDSGQPIESEVEIET